MAEMKQNEGREAEERTSVRARVIHEAIRRDGEEELNRSAPSLAWSGVAAGLAMGISLVAEATLRHYVGETHWTPLVAKLGYPVGFLIVILGKQQLFTENTLTPIIPLMDDWTSDKFGKLIKLWVVVFVANIVGAHLIAWFLASTTVLKHEFHSALATATREATAVDFWTALIRGIPAGWLIAMIVWLRAAVDSGELLIVMVLAYLVGVGGFTHVIAGSIDYLYLVFRGAATWEAFAAGYMLPVLVGNVIGGVTIVAVLNHAQVVSDKKP